MPVRAQNMNREKDIEEFGAVAKEFCDWAEGIPDTSAEEHLKSLALLSKLYATALALPETEPSDDFSTQEPPSIEYKKMHERFGSLPFQYYQDIFNPLSEEAEEPVTGDICDDLADIYKDIKEGLWYFEQHRVADAAFHWRMHFGFHWGRHLTSALKALHCYEPEEE